MKIKQLISWAMAMLLLCAPSLALAESEGASFHVDGAAFVDSLQYMLKGMVGIFLVTGLIILVLVVLEKASAGKKEENDP